MPVLTDAAEAFLADLADRGRSPNTLAAYRRDLAAYERYLAGHHLSVAQAGDEEVAAYVTALEGAGRRPASVARAVVAVRALHRWCGSDVVVAVDTPTPVGYADRAVLSPSEAVALVESARGGSAIARRDRALLELLYATGGRISEVVGLDVDDVARGMARLGGADGRNTRAVPYGEPAGAALTAWLSPPGRSAMGGRPGQTRALFLNRQGGRLSRQWGWSVVRSHGGRVGLAERLSPNVLRHSFAAHLTAGGAPPAAVHQLLVGTPAVLSTEELAAGYRRWHPRARRKPVTDVSHSH